MGEMIKFGIKLAMTIACSVALVAALALLFAQIPTFSNNSSFLTDIFWVISVCIPIKLNVLFAILSPLFAFKVAYWIADKTIQFIDAIG